MLSELRLVNVFHWFHQKFMLKFCDGFAIYLRYTDIFALYLRYQHICVVSEVSRHKSTDVDAEFDEEQR